MDTQIATRITAAHLDIARCSVEQAIALLERPDNEVLAYAVDTQSWLKGETLKMKSPDGRTIEIRISFPN